MIQRFKDAWWVLRHGKPQVLFPSEVILLKDKVEIIGPVILAHKANWKLLKTFLSPEGLSSLERALITNQNMIHELSENPSSLKALAEALASEQDVRD